MSPDASNLKSVSQDGAFQRILEDTQQPVRVRSDHHAYGLFFGMVTFVCVLALAGWRGTYTWGRTRRPLNLVITASAVILSLFGLTVLNAEFYLEVDQVRHTFDLKWLFIVPAILSGLALRRWLVVNRREELRVGATT